MAKAPKPEPSAVPDFEKALAELENIVSTLEKGDLSLEAALKHFERGISLTRQCQTALKEAELKVEQLVEKGGKQTLEPFETEEDE
ncbi:MAG TPA: exodeoxyribonuclease VII small subunit [Gammaproteobacteria bacterium]|nr:exodeoxyribonuclease VII small subunit [Gammaproteobacteria bacterium]